MARRKKRVPIDVLFNEAIEQVYEDCRVHGIAMIDLAEELGISRAQLPRWKKQVPKTIRILADLQAEVEKHLSGEKRLSGDKRRAVRRRPRDLFKQDY